MHEEAIAVGFGSHNTLAGDFTKTIACLLIQVNRLARLAITRDLLSETLWTYFHWPRKNAGD